ncbi:hypothetical protein DZS_19500 [Dickeya ananatis]
MSGKPRCGISPAALGIEVPGWDTQWPLIKGGNLLINPLSNVLGGPLTGQASLLTADIDTGLLVGTRDDLDVVGHRPDVLSLTVDEWVGGEAVRYWGD